ncbi:EAL domain-containing protein [Scandinavium sp. TWS1a]|uniref:EAL domain-containing protein n=1 Tax=Scandinavium tedordense TaxID=2926521 RepID=UPI002166BB5A|nr:EAL domain-containing protein [Scandinavium tedordense]MCS2170546.1 EAL domain-containing protein [Scandinavium tedordense]
MNNVQKKYPVSFVSTLVTALIVFCILLVLMICYLQKITTHSLLAETSEKMLHEESLHISQHVEEYLNRPGIAGAFVSHMAMSETAGTSQAINKELKHLLKEDFPGGESILCVGYVTADGQYIAYQRKESTNDLYMIKTAVGRENQLNFFESDSDSAIPVHKIENYNLFSRPWFNQAMSQKTPFWTPKHYTRFGADRLVMSWRVPVYQNNHHFLGVFFADIDPAGLSLFLKKQFPAEHGFAVLLDERGNIIASSDNQYLIAKQHTQQTGSAEFTEHLPFLNVASTQHDGVKTVQEEGVQYYVATHPFTDPSRMLKWSLVIVTPDISAPASLFRSHISWFIAFAVFVLAALAIMIVLIRRFFNPFNQLMQKARALGLQPWQPSRQQRMYPEIAALEAELSNASMFISGALDEHTSRLEQDSETGLLTRSGLVNQPSLYQERNLLLMLRLTNLNDIRSTLGHAYSKTYIRSFAQQLLALTPADTLHCRYAEDLFILIFPGVNEAKDLDIYWGLLSSLFNVANRNDSGDADEWHQYVFAGQAGGSLETLTAENISECSMNAAMALQHSRPGANRECVIFTPDMREKELNNVTLHQALLKDLQREGFHLVLQPIINLDSPDTFSEGECLIRWQSPVLGFVPPDKFIGLAERTGLIIPLGRWIVEEACQQLAAFIKRGAPVDFKLHINISAVQLQQADFSEHLLLCITNNGLINKNICLEITESVLLQDTDQVIEHLNYLRRLGLSFAIDDFGSGYSSLSYLHLLPFDCLKIDRGFVNGIINDKKSEAVISSVIMLSQQFKVPLVAEGVETAEMGQKLQQMGCAKAQGYYYARPQVFSFWQPDNGLIRLVTQP